jgi:hypothetical protein
VAFRDDREALRFRIRELGDEIDRMARERDRIRIALREIDGDVEGQVKAMLNLKKSPLAAVGILILVGGIGAGVFFAGSSGDGSSETMYGQVRSATGAQAPAAEGTDCTIFTRDEENEDEDSDQGEWSNVGVLCGGRMVYGGGSLGYLYCQRAPNRAVVRCRDGDFTSDGADPKLEFDRAAARVVVEERNWRVEIELTTPPSPAGGGA